MKERFTVDTLRLATPHIRKLFADATVREVPGTFDTYPFPAVTPQMRIAADITDIQAVNTSGWQRRFLVQKNPYTEVNVVPLVTLRLPLKEIDSAYVLSEIPFDALSLYHVHESHRMAGTSQQTAISIKRIIADFAQANPGIETLLQEHYKTKLRLHDVFSVSIRQSTLIFIG